MACVFCGGSPTTNEHVFPRWLERFLPPDRRQQLELTRYGADGYDLFGGNQSVPSYATVAAAGETAWTWAASTTDLRALQQSPGSTSRLAAAWASPTSLTFDVNLTDGNAHRVALYLVDWDSTLRSETVTMTDAATGSVLDSRAVSAFHGGEYLVWTATGHFKITIARTGGANAVASGILFG